MEPAIFWSLTCAETVEWLSSRDERIGELVIAAAWHGANYQRAKRMPLLNKEMNKVRRDRRVITKTAQKQMQRNMLLHMRMMGVEPPPGGWESVL